MKELYKGLSERIRGESSDLDRLVFKAHEVWEKLEKTTANKDVYLDSVALNLHGFYSGLERIFELIAKNIDCHIPSGEMWHRGLLKQMGQEIEEVRPAVISTNAVEFLDELRRFRHLVRNVYTFNLVPEKIEPLIKGIFSQWPQMKLELLAFADFLEALAESWKD